MQAALFRQHGGPEVIEIADLPTPEPGPGEVRVAVRAVALNHLDLWVRRGLPNLRIALPHVGGSDVAGEIDALGPCVEGWATGDAVVINPSQPCGMCAMCRRGDHPLCVRYRIMGEHTPGGMAEYVVVPADRLHPMPERLSFTSAAAVPLVYQTAWRAMVTRAQVRPGEDVLVLGASGGVATAAIQIALLAGARVIAVTSTQEQVEAVAELGADVVIDRLAGSWSKAVWQATGKRGADVIVENVGAATWRDSLRAAAPAARVVTYGATTGATPETDIRFIFWKQLTILGTTMSTDDEFEAVLRLVARGDLDPVVGTVLPLADARRAHELLETGAVFGKVVMEAAS